MESVDPGGSRGLAVFLAGLCRNTQRSYRRVLGPADGSEDGFGDLEEQPEVFQVIEPLMADGVNPPMQDLFQMAMLHANGFPQDPAMPADDHLADDTPVEGSPEGSLTEQQLQRNQALGFL